MIDYKIVPLEEVIATTNPIELDLYNNSREIIRLMNAKRGGLSLPILDAWNYRAYHKNSDHISIGSASFPTVLSAIEKSLQEYQPFTGLILHGYRLDCNEQKQIMYVVNAPIVALMMEPPKREPKKTGSQRIGVSGLSIKSGFGHRLSIMM